jgi:phage gp45-like
MVQRSTPMFTSYRAYSGGGSRTTIHEVDDEQLMQESKGNFTKGETRDKVESPQNYGFTSVVADAEKGKDGQIDSSAEGFVSFMGGNRSFPVMGIMDDRRHRLIGLAKDAAKGAAAMFGLREWGHQHLITEDGVFTTGNEDKKIRMALVKNKNNQQQQPSQQQQANGAGAGGASSSGGGTQQKQKGQRSLHKEDSSTYVDMTKDSVHTVRGSGNVEATDSKTLTYHSDKSKSTRADDTHTHIKNGAVIWVSKGCFASMPIIIKDDPCDT